MKKTILAITIVILLLPVIFAHEHNFEEVEKLVKNNVPCDELSEEQLEAIGDYYMEQMHPGEMHEIMDERMGGEGSESLRLMHINMARSFYCGEYGMMGSGGMMGMMPMMMNRGGYNMMDSYGYGMMGNSPWFGFNIFGWLIMILVIVALILLIMLLIKQLQKK